jgi:hypothetical protein
MEFIPMARDSRWRETIGLMESGLAKLIKKIKNALKEHRAKDF